MTVPSTTSSLSSKRKRRVHRKSRLGCGNCKFRGVKCDETRPACRRCLDFEVSCNYIEKACRLQSSHEVIVGQSNLHCFVTHSPSTQRCSTHQAILGMMNGALASMHWYQLNMKDLERLSRFQERTVLTFGTPKVARVYQNEILRLSCLYPHLLHIVLTLTSMHDRTFAAEHRVDVKQTAFESYHCAQAAGLFSKQLSGCSERQARGGFALWATAVYLGGAAFFAIETTESEEAWPLKRSPSDLDWLQMQMGLLEVWPIVTNAQSPESLLRGLPIELDENCSARSSPMGVGINDMPGHLIDLFDLRGASNLDDNPYYAAMSSLLPLLDLDGGQTNLLRFFTFTNTVRPAFKALLLIRDPRALLLMALWYAKICRSTWWLSPRALLECRAICIYLDRYHAEESAIQALMGKAKVECGYCDIQTRERLLTPLQRPLGESSQYLRIRTESAYREDHASTS